MRPRTTLLLLFFLLLATYTTSSSTTTNGQRQTRHHHHHRTNSNSTGSCSLVDRDALLAFKQGITRDPTGRLASWSWGQGREEDADCCRWRGIRCSKQTNRVVAIQLGNAQPDDDDLQQHHLWDTALAGQISPSLLSLEYLEHLDLSMNDISGPTGGRVPEFLGLFKNLRYLNLSGMTFTGSVPSQLGNLSKLHFLDLSRPNLFAPSLGQSLYSNDISWLSNLPLLYLDLSYVDLSNIVDWARLVNTVPSLKVLRLVDCSLASAKESIPHLNLTGLAELRLSNNYLDHPVASCWFWNLTTLQYLELASTSLYGQMADALGALTSLRVLDFSYSIGSLDTMTANMTNLCNLETLDLQYSNMNGDVIELLPHCFPNRLKELYLGGNTFTGILPDWIGRRWSSLHILELYSNGFTGHLPSEIGTLKSLRILRLSDNQFNGPLPSEIGMLNNLVTLDLSNNMFDGPLPYEIGMLNNLHILHLYNNTFTGHVPSQIGMLSNLTTMNLSSNNLNGVITHGHFAGLASLRTIDLSSNFLNFVVDPEWLPPFQLQHATFASCQMGPLFPAWLRSQVGLVNLDISSTSIFDSLPDWFATTFSNAKELYISNNGINGTLPANLENMASLHVLYLDSNRLTGSIPQLPINLYLLDISRNNLSGILPPNFRSPNLLYLSLFSNRITGHIPQYICELNLLVVLNLANNCLEGEFPRCFEPRTVRVLLLNNNMLSGKLQSIFETYTELQILDLAWNKFTGSIPSTIAKLEGLSHLNLAGNGISGALPYHLSNLTGMKGGSDYYYDELISGKFNVSVTIKGQQRYYYDFAIYSMVSIDLSSNHLNGEIPEEIASLVAVVNLNLSRNNLTGKNSENIGVMQSLESLDLSANKLYGEIPQSMSDLTFLSFMDLSHNNLTGKIPSGGQLDTLYSQDPLMYDGNIGLYGYPLQKNCTDHSEPTHGHQTREEYDSKVLTFSFGLTIGYVVGLWVVFCAMLFKKSWRISYFHLVDKIYVFARARWAKDQFHKAC